MSQEAVGWPGSGVKREHPRRRRVHRPCQHWERPAGRSCSRPSRQMPCPGHCSLRGPSQGAEHLVPEQARTLLPCCTHSLGLLASVVKAAKEDDLLAPQHHAVAAAAGAGAASCWSARASNARHRAGSRGSKCQGRCARQPRGRGPAPPPALQCCPPQGSRPTCGGWALPCWGSAPSSSPPG